MKLAILSFLLPPGLVVTLLVAALYCWKKRAKTAKTLVFLALAAAWICATTAFGRFLSTTLIAQVRGPVIEDLAQADLIVVLTGGMTYGGDIGWLPTHESYRRGLVAYELQSRVGSRVPILFSGGRTAGLKYPSEAEVARRLFDRQQAQIVPTLLEESSTNTYESALQCAAVIQHRLAKQVFLVTSEVHMLRALAAFRGRGLDPIPFPVLTLPRGEIKLKDVLPSWQGVELTAKAVYEILGLVEYVVTGKVAVDDIFYR